MKRRIASASILATLALLSGCSINSDFINYTDNFVQSIEGDYRSGKCDFTEQELADRLANINMMKGNIQRARELN